MMNRLLLLLFSLLFFSILAFPQDNPRAEFQSLQNKLAEASKAGNLDDMISIAEKIAALEKRGGEKNISNYFDALHNLVLLKTQRLRRNNAESRLTLQNMEVEPRKIEAIFRELLIIAKKGSDILDLAMIQGELASFIDNRGHADEAAALFVESIANREKKLGPEAESILPLLTKLSQLYIYNGELEKFLPVSQRLVASLEKRYGEKDQKLIIPLSLYAGFLLTADREEEAKNVVDRIVKIQARSDIEVNHNNLVLRRSITKIDTVFGIAIDPAARRRLMREPQSSTGEKILVSEFPSNIPGNRTSNPNLGLSDSGPLQRVDSRTTYVETNIVVDEKGNVIDLVTDASDEKTKEKIRDRVSKWKFRPLILDGKAQRMRGRFFFTIFR